MRSLSKPFSRGVAALSVVVGGLAVGATLLAPTDAAASGYLTARSFAQERRRRQHVRVYFSPRHRRHDLHEITGDSPSFAGRATSAGTTPSPSHDRVKNDPNYVAHKRA